MLAVRQAPRMGSSQPPSDDPFLPFGYSVDPNEPLFDAPEPAPGAPLLTETDSRLLSSFFDDMTANQYNMPSFGEGLNFSDAWLDLPPQFMGTATSLGQQEGGPLASPPGSNAPQGQMDVPRTMPMSQLMPPPPPPPSAPSSQAQAQTRQRHSDEVLSAAATLLQNGSGSRGGSHNHNHNHTHNHTHNPNLNLNQSQNQSNQNSDFSAPRRPIPVGHLRHQPLEEFKKEGRRGSAAETVPHDNTFTEWMFGGQGRQAPRNVPNTAPADFQWGSDSNFSSVQGYTPDPNKETAESQQQDQLKCLDCLEVNKSNNTTGPSSPSREHEAHAHHNGNGLATIKRPEDVDAPPRKRRKSKNVKEVGADDEGEDEDDASTSTTKTARRRKSKAERASVLSSPSEENAGSGRRRKSAANGAKPSRENLSEEQKRENHIRSEQKRRTLIKEGFEDLCILVPGLRGGGFSKSTMLSMTAEWLEDMLKGNEALSAQLASLEGR